METLGTRIQTLRKAKGLSVEKLAREVDCSWMSVRRWEADEREPSLEFTRKLAAALDVSVAELVDGNNKEAA